MLSSITTSCVLSVVVVPLTVRLPVITAFPPTVKFPVCAGFVALVITSSPTVIVAVVVLLLDKVTW
jgi:hypothetical protein